MLKRLSILTSFFFLLLAGSTSLFAQCPDPDSLEVTAVGSTTVDLTWVVNGTETNWDYELVDITAGESFNGTIPDGTFVSTTPQLTGLDSDNEYEVWLRANCIFSFSGWIGPVTFTTDPSCYPIVDIVVTNVDTTEFTIEWSPAASDTMWNLEMVDITSGGSLTGSPTDIDITDSSVTYTGLTPGYDYQIAIQANCGLFDGLSEWSDTVFVTTDELCIIPANLGLSSLGATSATAVWSPQDNETSWELEIVNFTLGEIQDGNADYLTFDSTQTFPVLIAENEYHIFVRANCGGSDGDSEWSEAFIFETPCAPYTLPFGEHFDTNPVDCWTVENNGLPININQFGNSAIRVSPSTSPGNSNATSPLIDNTGPSRVFFSWSHKFEDGDADTLALYGSSNGGGTWTLLWEKHGSNFNSFDGATLTIPGSYVNQYVPLTSAFDNNEIALQFRFGSGGGISGDTWIDSVAVELAPDCNFAYNIEFSNVGQTSATVDFDIFGSGATSWDYEIVEAGFGPTGIATGTTTSSNFVLTGLTPGTLQSIYMKTTCTVGASDWVGPYSFITDCAVITEFLEGFETTDNGEIPMCWDVLEVGPAMADVSSTWSPMFDSKHFYFRNGNAVDTALKLALISPELSNIDGGTHWLRFWARHDFQVASFNIGTLTDPTDLSTFSSFETVNVTNTYQEYFVNFTNFVGSGDYIAIKFESPNTNARGFVDRIQWQEIPTCFPPTDVQITNIDTASVDLDITPANLGDTLFHISLIDLTAGGSFTGLPTDTISLNANTLDGLTPGNFYEIYVRTACSGSDVSDWTTFSYSFGTNCVEADTISEGFEILSPINGFPACWIPFESPNTDVFINTNSFNSYSGNNSLRLSNFGTATTSNYASLSSPALSDITADTKMIKFFAKKTGGPVTLKIGTTTDPLDPSSFVERMSVSLANGFQEYNVPFVGYTGPGEHVVFYLQGGGGSQTAYIDAIGWVDAPSCGEVVGLTAETVFANTADISWLPVSQDTTWYLELVPIPGVGQTFVPTDTSTSLNYTLNNLSENSIYDVYVKPSCAGASWTGPITFVTLYEENVGIGDLISPAEEGCGLTTSEEVVVELINSGGNYQTNVPLEYSWDIINWFSAGSYTDTLFAGDTVDYVLPNTFDFSMADDTTLYVRTVLATDADAGNNSNVWQITNNGDTRMNLEIAFGAGSSEIEVLILDSITGNTAYSLEPNFGLDNTTQNYELCLFSETTYEFQANDNPGDGWEGGTYLLTACGGVPIADNGGVSPDNGVGTGPWPWSTQIEASEYFNFEGCADNNLTVSNVGGPYSACGLDTNETFDITILNNGILDLDSADAELQINFNGNGFVTLTDFPNGLEPDSSFTFTTSEYDLSTSGSYTIDVSVVFATDEFMDDNTASFDVISAPTLETDTADFDSDNGLWANDNVVSGNASWEWGVPTSTILSNGASGSVWATGLSTMVSPNEEYYLESPCYDFTNYSFAPEILYDYVYDAGSSTVQFQVSTDGGANYSNIETYSNTATWTQGVHLLATFIGESDVKFRWKFVSGTASGVEGFAFDNWSVIEHIPYTDASLSDLEVNGVTVAGFDSAILSYTVTLPYGATSIPSVIGTPTAAIVDTIIYDEAVLPLPDTTFITVIAEDTLFSTTYMVIFEEALPSSNNDLSMITVDAVNIPGFNASILIYGWTVPFGGSIPDIDATVADPTATLSITQAGTLPGSAVIIVTAQDGTTQTYTVSIDELPPSTDADLIGLTIDGTPVPGFHADTLTYTASSFATPLPIVAAVASDPNITSLTVNQVGAIPGSATVVVVAEDGVTTKVYTINFDLLLNINAQLLGIDVDGVPLAGFNTNIYTYTMELPYNASVPTLTATLEDPLASYNVIDAPFIPGTSVVVVTAENGVITQNYSIIWEEALPNNNAHLTDISLIGGTVGSMTPGFSSGTLEYLICLGDGNPNMPEFNFVLADSNASFLPILPDSIPGDMEVVVTAEDGLSVTTYTLLFRNCYPLTLEEDVFELIVYPNPNEGSIMIQTNADVEDFKMLLINQIGSVVFSKDQSQIQLNESIELDGLSNGVYILRLYINNTWYTERITILR